MDITEVGAYIQENLSEDLIIKDLAKKCFLSTTGFKIRFKVVYGETVGIYINRRRMYAAAEMLTSGDNSTIRSVGVEMGYSNLSNFARAFYKFYGHLPSEVFIKRYKKIEPVNEGGNSLTKLVATCPEHLKAEFENHFGLPILKILNLAHAV